MSVDRGFTWVETETLSLIEIFSRDDIQQELHSAKRNINTYEKIADELSEMGFQRNAFQCREKIKRLRKEYQHVKFCMNANVTPKKSMKHFELVDRVFNHQQLGAEPSSGNFDSQEDFVDCFAYDQDTDDQNVSNNSPQSLNDDDEDALTLNVDQLKSLHNSNEGVEIPFVVDCGQNFESIDKDSSLDEDTSPWVPNVVLVENDSDISFASDGNFDDGIRNDAENPKNTSAKVSSLKDFEEPANKKRKLESHPHSMQGAFEHFAERFLEHQQKAESRILEQLSQLERDRMKRDERMHKLWLDLEERRRKDEQEHEIHTLSLFGQFLNRMVPGRENNAG